MTTPSLKKTFRLLLPLVPSLTNTFRRVRGKRYRQAHCKYSIMYTHITYIHAYVCACPYIRCHVTVKIDLKCRKYERNVELSDDDAKYERDW